MRNGEKQPKYICFCRTCGKTPEIEEWSGDVSCRTYGCRDNGYTYIDIQSWNEVMESRPEIRANPCKYCGTTPYISGIGVSGRRVIECRNDECEHAWLYFDTLEYWNRSNPIKDVTVKDDKFIASNNVAHPSHYNWLPNGIECMDIVKHFDFILGNVLKYIWRCGYKSTTTKLEDLEKARYYIDIAIAEEKAKHEK